MKRAAVIDIGKTNAKVVLVDMETLAEAAVRKRANQVLAGPPYPHYDVEGLWAFILESLRDFQASHGVDGITVTTHGASAVLLDDADQLAGPVLDYEHAGPDDLAVEYDAVRPDFAETGSPRLPLGLNLGAQLFWQLKTFPDIRARTKRILTYPQYWAWRLCGVATNEVTSLGCHTDLWAPRAGRYSSLVENQGWAERMAPVAKAADKLGPVLPEIARQTGLDSTTPVVCGIHDSNASLYAHLAARKPPFAVVSTGTWVISMAVGGKDVELDPARDTLINVNALGDPVPSARFMGGREFERLMGEGAHTSGAVDVTRVLEQQIMLLPAVEVQSGPFQGRRAQWTAEEKSLSAGERYVAISFYLAMMTATGLEIVGADGPVLVEGPFAGNGHYLEMLRVATKRDVQAVEGTGTSIGAALLLRAEQPAISSSSDAAICKDESWRSYAASWRALAM